MTSPKQHRSPLPTKNFWYSLHFAMNRCSVVRRMASRLNAQSITSSSSRRGSTSAPNIEAMPGGMLLSATQRGTAASWIRISELFPKVVDEHGRGSADNHRNHDGFD